MKRGFVVFVLVSTLTACEPLYIVTRKPKGIPFYPIKQVETTTVTRAQRWIEITLSWTTGDKKPWTTSDKTQRTIVKYVDAKYAQCAGKLLSIFNSAKNQKEAKESVFRKIENGNGFKELGRECNIEDWDDTSSQPDRFTEANKINKLPIVSVVRTRGQRPAEKPMYINVKRAAAGTSSATVKLAANGTLSEGPSVNPVGENRG